MQIEKMILVHVFIYLGVKEKVKRNQRRKYPYIWLPSYKITHFIFSLYCVVVQHNNKLRTIENKQERNGVGVRCKNAELCLIDNTDEKHLKQRLVQTYHWTLTKNEFKVYYHLAFTCSLRSIDLPKLVNTISYEMHN